MVKKQIRMSMPELELEKVAGYTITGITSEKQVESTLENSVTPKSVKRNLNLLLGSEGKKKLEQLISPTKKKKMVKKKSPTK